METTTEAQQELALVPSEKNFKADNKRATLKRDEVAVVMRWWHSLEADRGARARLRRAKNYYDLLLVPDFNRLTQDLRQEGFEVSMESLEMLGLTLPSLKASQWGGNQHPARVMGRKKNDRVLISTQRFGRLMACKNHEKFQAQLQRVLTQMPPNQAGGRFLVGTLLSWGKGKRHPLPDDIFAGWAEAYYESAL